MNFEDDGGLKMALANILLNLRSAYPTLSPAERKVADVVSNEPSRVVYLSVAELARQAEVSEAMVIKFCKRLGYKGFQEFKILLAQDLVTKPEPIYGEIDPDDDLDIVKEKIFQSNIAALQDTVRVLSTDVMRAAIEAFGQANEIHFYGIGASGLVALDAEQKFSRIGLRVNAFNDAHMQLTRATLLKPGDVAVGLSYSGETPEIKEALEVASRAKALTIAITNYSTSSVARVADLVLLTASQENIFRCGAISSRIAQLSAIDTLFIGVALVDFDQSVESIEKTGETLARHKLNHRQA